MIMKESDRQTQTEALLKNNVSGIAMLDNGQRHFSLMELLIEEGVSMCPMLSPGLLENRKVAVKWVLR